MKKHPVIILALLFAAGLIIGSYISPPAYFSIIYTAFLILLLIAYWLTVKKKTIGLLLSLYVYAGIILAGIFYYSPPRFFPLKEVMHKEQAVFIGTVRDINISGKNEKRFTIETDSVIFRNTSVRAERIFYCVVRTDSGEPDLLPGYRLGISGIYYKGKGIRNPGEFDYESYLEKTGISGYIYSEPADIKIISKDENEISAAVYRVRKSAADILDKYHSPSSAALLKGLLLADRSDIEQDVRTNFINSGTAHILAVSGLHIGYIIIIFLLLAGRMNLYFRYLFTCAGIFSFMIITGMPVSVVRASIMAVIILTAQITNRSAGIYNALALSALIILLNNPMELWLPGFQLSYAAVISIAAIQPLFVQAINKKKIANKYLTKILLFISLCLAAQIGTMPFVLYYFSKLSILSLLSNLLVVPLSGLIIGAAFVTIISGFISPFIASVFASSSELMNSLLFLLVKITGDPGYSFVWVRDFSVFDSVLFYLLPGTIIFLWKRSSSLASFSIITVSAVFLGVFFISIDDREYLRDGVLSCYMIDVGQGDAVLLKFPSGKTALIDAGDAREGFDAGERIIHPLLDYLGIRKIDYAFVSHIDSDHYSGFVHLAQAGLISRLYKPPPDTTARDKKFEKFLRDKRILIKYYRRGIISEGSVRIYFLSPEGLTAPRNNNNDMSAVMKIVYGTTSILFTGDAGIKAERFYITRYDTLLRSDVLKVSHHGSAGSTSDEFLECVRPRMCLISAGEKNKFGHPSEITLQRIDAIRGEVSRTDREGGILIYSDGSNFKKINWKEI